MTTWAQVQDATALNVRVVDPADSFNAEWLESNQAFVVVPDKDTAGDLLVHGAHDNGDGTFTNPAPQVAAPTPRILSKTAFQDYAVSQLGSGMTGMARFTEIMDATRDSANGAVRFAYARYQAAQTFEKENTGALTQIMAADTQTGHITTDERNLILDNWLLEI